MGNSNRYFIFVQVSLYIDFIFYDPINSFSLISCGAQTQLDGPRGPSIAVISYFTNTDVCNLFCTSIVIKLSAFCLISLTTSTFSSSNMAFTALYRTTLSSIFQEKAVSSFPCFSSLFQSDSLCSVTPHADL